MLYQLCIVGLIVLSTRGWDEALRNRSFRRRHSRSLPSPSPSSSSLRNYRSSHTATGIIVDDDSDVIERPEQEEEHRKWRQGENDFLFDEEPYFDVAMNPTYTAYLGKEATLTCIVHAAKSDKSVSWIRSRDLRILTVGRYTYTSDLRFEALHQKGTTEWTLRIKSVQHRDAGNYECQITTKPIKTFRVNLKVVEPSVEILGAPDLFINRASMINLTCVIYHSPIPPAKIEWFHNNKSISYTSPRGGVSVVEERGEITSSFLLLQNATLSDSGLFMCRPRGLQVTSVNLHVLEGEYPAAMQTNSSTLRTSSQHIAMFLVVTSAVVNNHAMLAL
ncbi:zwei Ig domain protein zig-8-like [Oratosquilla oratoria]|uniref:zwei Ig domain protein zig-8-like n=1 Tax=Oratosquilla oratoria TaxID=337810 RepID=UPI003F772C6B